VLTINATVLKTYKTYIYAQSRISRTPYPQLGGTLSQGAQNSSPVTT